MSGETIEAFGRKWKWVWAEDDATRNDPTAEHLRQAWERLFSEPYQRAPMQDAEEDWGDATAVRIGERVVVSTFDGDSIYVPAEAEGPPAECIDCPERGDFKTLCCKGPVGAVVEYVPPADPYTAMVREFHERMGLVVRDAPSLGTPAERAERVRLMLEELLELARALGVSVLWAEEHIVWNVSDFTIRADGTDPEGANVLHELADLQVTVSGTAVQFGLPLLAAAREVHAANMRKMPQGPGRKPLKPDGWKPADVSGLVENVAHSVDLAPLVAALEEAPGAVLRQLAGAGSSQPVHCDRIECRPFAVSPCVCSCACHEVTP